MNNLEFLSKERIETTIRILKQVKEQGGRLDLTHFSTLGVDRLEQVHPCGNSACIIGYVSLSKEWAEVGGGTNQGRPKLEVPDDEWDYQGRAEFASMWFTGKELNEENLVEVQQGERTLAVVLAEAICLLLDEDSIEDLTDNVRDELFDLLSVDMEEGIYGLNDEIIEAVYGKEAGFVTVEDAIKALEWLLTLEITR